MPFDPEIREYWPLTFGYCALLAFGSIGLARLGRRAVLLLALLGLLSLLPMGIALALIYRNGATSDSVQSWFYASLYLSCVGGALALYLALRGWLLYVRDKHHTA